MEHTNDILNELASWDSPLANMSRSMPYIVPQNYFEKFPEQVMTGITDSETMMGLPKSVPFASPKGYFETFPVQILKAAAESDNKIIPLKRRTIERQLGWAAAAILLICIGFGASRSLIKHPYDTERALAAVPKSEINAYVQQNIDDFDVDMIISNMAANGVAIQPKQLDNKEIIEYLNKNGWQDTD